MADSTDRKRAGPANRGLVLGERSVELQNAWDQKQQCISHSHRMKQ